MLGAPSEAALAQHGLYDFELDVPPTILPILPHNAHGSSSSLHTTGDRIAAWARIRVAPGHPTLVKITPGERVRVYWTPMADAATMTRFRRQAQVTALDGVQVHDRADPLWSDDPMDGTHASSSRGAGSGEGYGVEAELIAWWEDDWGYWLVTRETVSDFEDLVVWWSRLFGTDMILDGAVDRKGKQPMSSLDRYGETCDMLEKVVNCLQALQDKKLTLLACRPHTFAVTDSPRRAAVIRLSDVAPLPGFSAASILSRSSLSNSPLFLHDPIDPSYNYLNDTFVRRNLRYLSPGVASTRRLSNTSCIYSFGVLAYELVTGSTIDGGRASPDENDVDLLADIHRHVTRDVMPPLERLRREREFGGFNIDLPPKQLNDIIMKCLSKDLDDRYGSLHALAWDLRKLAQICRASGDLDKFTVGEVDRLSRFHLPPRPVYRENEQQVLDEAFAAVAGRSPTSSTDLTQVTSPLLNTRIVNVWGYSGSGKSRVVMDWAGRMEALNDGQTCLLGYSKLDEHIQKPLSSFSQVFSSLLDRLLTDPKEDAKAWNKKIRDVLGSQYSVFLSLLPQDVRKLLTMGSQPPPIEAIDWANFMPAFKLWSKRLLQIFASKTRPLILLLDDIHWMPAEEVSIWRALLDGQQTLNYTLIISIFRVDINESPPPSALLSATTSNLFMPRLPEAGVAALTRACFQAEVDNLPTLASFLFAETQGSPLYVRTLLVTLAREQVIYFDFGSLLWRFDALALQSHLSDQNVDNYLRKVQGALPHDVREMLAILSCLPVNGFDIELLAQLLGRPHRSVELDVTAGAAVGVIIRVGKSVKFTHDRQRAAAQHLIPHNELGATHLKLAEFLQQDHILDDYVFDATDHASAAYKLGELKGKEEELLYLLLRAASRAAISASFVAAKSHLDEAFDLIRSTGGPLAWLRRSRELYFDFAKEHSQVCGVLGLQDESLPILAQLVPHCETASERVRIATLQFRLLVSANRMPEAISILYLTLDQNGYSIDHPTAIRLWRPRVPADVDELERSLSPDTPDENDVRVQIITLLAFSGATVFVSDVDRRARLFGLGVSICKAIGKVHPATVYLVCASSITITDRAVKEKMWRLGKRLTIGSSSFLVSSALVCLSAVAHEWVPLDEVCIEMDLAFNATIAHGNYELAAYVVGLDLHARRFSNKPYNFDLIKERFETLRPYMSVPSRFLVLTPIQYASNLLDYPSDDHPPWSMEGPLLTLSDMEQVGGLTMHRALLHTFALRLAILYDAPLPVQQQLVKEGSAFSESLDGIVAGPEWAFLAAIVGIQSGDAKPVQAAFADLRSHTGSPDFALRIDILNAYVSLRDDGLRALGQVETLLAKLDKGKYCLFSGLVNHAAGMSIIRATGNIKLATGYLRSASASYRSAESAGLCEMLRTRYGTICPPAPPARRVAAEILTDSSARVIVAPPLRRASISHGDTSSSNLSAETALSKSAESGSTSDNLDTLTLMRSSLALASEQDPPILLCTLLRILCQFARADYAAIALNDDNDTTALRLRAAGEYGRILPYDLSIADDATQTVCPAVVMLHVARTGNAITKVSSVPRMRPDPFYSGKTPRSLICLTISNQGRQSGVILLSSMTTSNTQAHSSSAREVISTLATFATIIISNYSFTRRLKLEVEQRTQELTNALQAKTQFLSQCSHELRSPLSAVLGLAAVLEASPGLTGVQREHLRTIISSGEDLLGLINNILDHSRLESNSVTLEHIPFSLREVAEEALDTVAAVAQKKNIEVCLLNSFKTDPPDMLGDPFRIKQVLLNLLANAVKFTLKGRVTVKWRFEIMQDDRVGVILDVEDTGIGIPAQKMNKLFHSFSQIDESITRSFGGSGLGLIISKDLAKLLGGDCTAESEYGKGSKFTFSFIADRGTQEPRKYATFNMPKSCFVICPPDPWWQMLEENLTALGCKPLRFQDDARDSVVKGHREGLNCDHDYDFVMVDTTLASHQTIDAMIQLQPKAKFIYLVRSLDMSRAMRDYNISREAIVARPIKFDSLYEALVPDAVVSDLKDADAKAIDEQGGTPKGGKYKNRKKVNRELSRTHPLEILLVDDNAVNITVGKRILEMFGYMNVPAAVDGQQAIEFAEKKQYDLILLDLQMPVMDGFRAHERIKASPLAGDPCVVALTANADQATEKQCNEAGFFDYLSKPLDIPRLETILGVVFDHRKNNRQLKVSPDME